MAITINSPTREGALLQIAYALAKKASDIPNTAFTFSFDGVASELSATFAIPLRQQPRNESTPSSGRYWQAYHPDLYENGAVKDEFLIVETPDTAALGYQIDQGNILEAFWIVVQDINAAENAAEVSVVGGASYLIDSDTLAATGSIEVPLTISLAPNGEVGISAVEYLA